MRLLPLIQDVLPSIPDSVPTVKSELSLLKSLPLDELLDKFVAGLVTLAINLLIAGIVFYAGKFIIRKLYTMVSRILLRRRVDNSLATFVLSFIRIVLFFILIVTVIGILGIETSSFLAIFASAGVAVGMALSGTLQNFAGGVLILLLKPYRVGDYIEAQGFAGTVKEIQIFSTIILTPDNKSITIPNGGLSTGSINNYSRENYRRVDWTVGISYGDSVDTARRALLAIVDAEPRLLKADCSDDEAAAEDPECAEAARDESAPERPRSFLHSLFSRHKEKVEEWKERREEQIKSLQPRHDFTPSVVVDSLDDSAVTLKLRAWTRTADYWGVYYAVNEQIYKQLPGQGVNFPFPQLDLHLPDGVPNEIKQTTYDKQQQMELSPSDVGRAKARE